ncbi:MAG TPA: hypothetical protein VNL14_20520 [Candidatus Acidoferrales bacterium]|nr:hypothetical protein [Candidatus Acidoferrales bacterium]
MEKKILVPLKKDDRIEEMIPYIKQVAQSDTTIVFLIHHPVRGFKWLQVYCAAMEGVTDNALALWRMAESYSVETRRQMAEKRVFHTCAALQKLGVKIAVDTYSGGLRKALRSHIRNGDVELILTKPWIGLRITSFLRESVCLWSVASRYSSHGLSFKIYGSESTLRLLHPGT